MPYAVTHVLVAIVIFDLLRHYVFGKDKFPRYLVVLGGIAGLAPDLDIPLGWLYSFLTGIDINIHGLFTHSFFFVGLFLLVGLIRRYQNDGTTARVMYVIAAGWLIHIILDWAFGEYKAIFWPFLLTDPTLFPTWNLWQYGPEIDAILLVAWLIHEEVQGMIKDYF